MQINGLNAQNQASFGMALKITPKAAESLRASTMEKITKLQKIGEELADTKYYHLEIGENLAPKIESPFASAYTAPFSPVKPNDEYLKFKTTWAGTPLEGRPVGSGVDLFVRFENEKAAQKAYEEISQTYSDMEQGAKLTKLLDDRHIAREAEDAAKKNLAAKVREAADDLISKFGAPARERNV